MLYLRRFAVGIALLVFSIGSTAEAAPLKLTPEQAKFFETRVRPILVKRCYKCHSSKAKPVKGGLQLDSHDSLHKGGDSGKAVVPGKPDASLLIRAIRYQTSEMPPDGQLPKREIRTLVEWVKIGAPFPATKPVRDAAAKTVDWEKERRSHWAWQPIRNPGKGIDTLIQERLHKAKVTPNGAATKRDLIRRAYFDLIGLPPSPQQVRAFESDRSKTAFARVVNQLLARPEYGERWGRHWLDVARYSDGFGGFLDNRNLPLAWRYRDWVVASFNEDKPYNEFVREQIAGDLISGQARVATGFFALGPAYKSDGGDPDSVAQAKIDTLDDRIDTLSRGFLAMTVSCARCHDHKFDPIPQLDYYSIAGVFNNTRLVNSYFGTKDQLAAANVARQAVARLDRQAKQFNAQIRRKGRKPTKDELAKLAKLQAALKKARQNKSLQIPQAHALADSGKNDMRVALRGNLRKPGPVAPRRMLRILAGKSAARFTQGSGRLELAAAVTDPSNPLLARVIVNRVWLHHFGRALVRSPSNFGTLGQRPTHPKLLDWLAFHFVNKGWSIKWLHRTIMKSAAYQRSADLAPQAFDRDGDNRLIWRMNPRRMDVETWRDSLLAVSAELDLQHGGPPVNNLLTSHRRTLYARTSRTGDRFGSDVFLRLFDYPIPRATVPQRVSSTVPQQYLFMMNSSFMVERAKAFAKRLEKDRTKTDERIMWAYELLYGRRPTKLERQLGHDFLTSAGKNTENKPKLTPWQQYSQVLLSSNEFMFVR